MADTDDDIELSIEPLTIGTREGRFTALYQNYAGEIHAYCIRRVPAGEAEDVVAEVFTVAWRRLDEVDPTSVRGWLYGVARGVLSNSWRSSRRRNRLRERLVAQTDRRLATDHDNAGSGEAVLAAMGGLNERDREILLLWTWEELTGPEIAVALGISEAAVHQRIHRARKRLAQTLQEYAMTDENGAGR